MTKIAKNQKMLPAGDKERDDALCDGADAAPKPVSMFKPRPHGDDDFDPLDLANALTYHDPEDLHPSALADQGDEESINPWRWFHSDGLTLEDVDRQDRAINSVQMGKPRTVFLPTGPVTYLRLTDQFSKDTICAGGGEGAEHQQRARLKLEADTPVKLIGPKASTASVSRPWLRNWSRMKLCSVASNWCGREWRLWLEPDCR